VVNANREVTDGIHELDLNHHLIPDPVADAIACLLERIRLLEQTTGIAGCKPGGEKLEDECNRCDAKLVCEPEPSPVNTAEAG
jgi:serine O-acetyltransferase